MRTCTQTAKSALTMGFGGNSIGTQAVLVGSTTRDCVALTRPPTSIVTASGRSSAVPDLQRSTDLLITIDQSKQIINYDSLV